MRRASALPLVLAAIAIAACGGDDETAAPAPPELTVPTQKDRPGEEEPTTTGETTTDGTTTGATTSTQSNVDQPSSAGSGSGGSAQPGPPSGGSSGGAGGGAGGGRPDRSKPDSAGNDVPPKPGTPEDRFEEFCDENPEACG